MSTTLTSRLQSFETELLTQEGNLAGLAAINRELVAKAETIDSPQRVLHTALPGFRCSEEAELATSFSRRSRSGRDEGSATNGGGWV